MSLPAHPAPDATPDDVVQFFLDLSESGLNFPAPEDKQYETALLCAQLAVDSAHHNPTLLAQAQIQCSVCFWHRGEYTRAFKSLDSAKKLNQTGVWSKQHDVSLQQCNERAAEEANEQKKKKASRRRLPMERPENFRR